MSTPGTRGDPVHTPSQAEKVLSRAVLRAADALGLSRRELAEVLGVSAASLSRLCASRWMSPQSKEGELGLLFIRVFRSLDALVGGDAEAARAWLRAPNTHLGGVPAEMLARVEGLVRVAEYLDAMRGRI
jgi:hypothetical protein